MELSNTIITCTRLPTCSIAWHIRKAIKEYIETHGNYSKEDIMSELIYLATPYTDPDPEVRQSRYEAAMKTTARMLQEGQVVFSPIVYGHAMALRHDLPTEWDFWWKIDETMLGRCDKVVVLMLDGWDSSKGVRDEIKLADKYGIQVEKMEAVN